MSDEMIVLDDGGKMPRPKVDYHGFALGNVECAVLEGGRRGYIYRGLREALGIRRNIPVPAFERFCAEIAPNALPTLTNSASRFEVTLPGGQSAIWVEAGILTQVANGVIRSALAGKLRANRRHMIEPCMAIMEALGHTGEVALIDEATGYQHHRAPDALQDLYSRLISEKESTWERRFHPSFYAPICKLFNIPYGNKHRPLPSIIGQITERFVYLAVFPKEVVEEIKARRKSEKLFQWLEKDGLKLLEKQRDAVAAIASSSVDYRDFEARCAQAFHRPGQQLSIIYPQGGPH